MTSSPGGARGDERNQDSERDRRGAALKTTVIVVTAVIVLATLAWMLTERLLQSSVN